MNMKRWLQAKNTAKETGFGAMLEKARRSMIVSIAMASLWAVAPMTVRLTVASVPGHTAVTSGTATNSTRDAGGDDTGWD
jgi:hypothetical protein